MIQRAVALQLLIRTGVRPFFLAWLTLALLLFALGRLSRAIDGVATAASYRSTAEVRSQK
jgi:hypothetical protein